ncbi:hypothetical protein PFLUV_G00012780 [Perca fluviatilis]|uniref:Uncharacterized protein n=1 Tax=Perca fluviatilis TaxID=8168 RepID=A0A6A5FSE2_PERFL|nr:hypothetical protein PFLUV_G00012780 [Perca fluviatilis]
MINALSYESSMSGHCYIIRVTNLDFPFMDTNNQTLKEERTDLRQRGQPIRQRSLRDTHQLTHALFKWVYTGYNLKHHRP